MLDVRATGEAPCTHVAELLTTKLDDVQVQIEELLALQGELATLLSLSERLDPADCTERQICHILQT